MAAVARAEEEYPYCQILDRVDEPAWQAHVGYVGQAKVRDPNGSDVGLYQLRGGGGLYYWRTAAGDIDLSGAYDVTAFDGSGGIDLPDQVAALRLNASYTWRQWDGAAVKVDVFPGIYSDLKDLGFDDLYMPFQVLGIQAFNPQLSGVLGVAIYPGFSRSFDPRFGVRYAVSDELSVDVMYPESRVTYHPAEQWDLYAGLRNNPVAEFRLEDGDDRDAFEYDEARAYLGVNAPLNDVVRVMAQLGWTLSRSVDFDRVQPARDVQDAFFVSVGLGGTL